MTGSPPSKVETVRGSIVLPSFLPDATRAVVKSIDSQDLERSGVNALMVNTFHLISHPGSGLIKSMGGVHTFMNWPHPVASDSGGFQLMSVIRENRKYGTISDKGVSFTPLGGGRKTLRFSPEKSIRIQFDLGSDVMISLDDCPSPQACEAENLESVQRTVHWAERCKREFDKLLSIRRREDGKRPLIFGVIHGGYDTGLRQFCAGELLSLGFDGFGFGGWPLDPEGNLAEDILRLTARLIPDHLPKFALGVGKPEGIVRCSKMGWTLFDCVLPTRDARHGRLYAFRQDSLDRVDINSEEFYHYVYIRDKKHKRDRGPISRACDCYCCANYSIGYVHHLFDVRDPLGYRLATIHNLRFYTQLVETIRERSSEQIRE